MRKNTRHTAVAIALGLALAAGSVQATPPQAESGRWITQSGNLEVEIAPCGEARCGTVVRVIDNRAMAGPAAPAATAAAMPSPLGKQILFGLLPLADGGLQGRIYNRADNKTYNSILKSTGKDELTLTIYQDTPDQGQVQVWQRAPMPE
jgi:uncharacterized protein (DUF2147 family)